MLVVFFLVFCLSSNKDEEGSKTAIRDVTGLNLYDANAVPQGAFGNPNSFSVGGLAEIEEVVEYKILGDSEDGLSVRVTRPGGFCMS